MSQSLLLLAVLGLAAAQHGGDPFAHANCTCKDYCAGSCAINTTLGNYKHQKQLYRMTPYVARTLTNKNTGDAKGDTSFVLSRKDISEECLQDPDSPRCFFNGDDPNSTDLVIEFNVELDGQWGPYEYCNPVHTNDPTSFSCQANYDGGGSMKMNVSCQCDRMNVTVGWENKSYGGYSSSYECYRGQCYPSHHGNQTAKQCADTCVPPPTPPPTPPPAGAKYFCHYGKCIESHFGHDSYDDCEKSCSSGGGGSGHGKSMGSWFSHPMNGQCNGTHTVGDGSGCTWKAMSVTNVINASCLYKQFDSTIEAYNGSYCFKGCGVPLNRTSICYRQCYTKTYSTMTDDEVTQIWIKSFASQDKSAGGCPTVKIPELTMSHVELNPEG